MSIETKSFDFDIKKAEDGSFEWEGYVAAYNNVDSYGDVIVEGAGADNVGLKTYAMWEHKELSGMVEVTREDNIGLYVKGKLMPDDIMTDNLKGLGSRLRWLADQGLTLKMSIGWYPLQTSSDIPDQFKGANRIIQKFELAEGSIVLFPANDKAVVTSYKSIGMDDVDSMTERELEKALKSGQPLSKSLSEKIVTLLKQSTKEISKVDGMSIADEILAAAKSIGK